MARHVYIFAGFPSTGLNAGGLTTATELENICELEFDSTLMIQKSGVYIGEEWLEPTQLHISDMCIRDGITLDWFPSHWLFGTGVTVHKTLATPEYKTVVHGTNLTLDEFLTQNGVTDLSGLRMNRYHVKHEGWEEYEARWLPNTCPQEKHVVHLTWLVTTHKIPDFAYNRLKELIEDGAEPNYKELYSEEKGKHFSEIKVLT